MALRLRDRYIFMWQSLEILSIFSALTLKYVFWKTKAIFEKLYDHLLVKSTAIESVLFLWKSALLKANVKTNRMGSKEWTYRKEPSFDTHYFMFLKI